MKEFLLSELLQIRNGKDYKHLSKGPYPVYGSGGLMQSVDDYLYDKPSILLPRKGSLSNIQFADTPFWTVDTLYYTEVDESKADAYYLYYYLKSLDLSNLDSGTGIPSMTFDSYYNIGVSIPVLSEQKRVSALLRTIDDTISVIQQINDYLEAMARQIYDYWFVQFDFPDENGRPYKSSGGKMVWNEKLKREIPSEWTDNNLESILDLFDFKRVPLSSIQRASMKGLFPYYGATGIMDYINDYIFDGEYVLLAEDGSTSNADGSPIVQYIWGKNWVNNHAHILLPKERHNIHYTFLQLKSIPAKMMETGSIQKKISQENLLIQRVVAPQQKIIDAFETVVIPIWEEKKNVAEQINALLKQRDGLLPFLMNGQASVRPLNNHLSHY